jgi:hypothetical protein
LVDVVAEEFTEVGAEPPVPTFTLEIPGPAGGVVALLEELQLASNTHRGNTNNNFFILTGFASRKTTTVPKCF